MIRIALTVLAFVALAGTASAAGPTVVGTGTTAWGQPFSLSVSTEKAAGRTMRCLEYEQTTGGGAGCPLTRPDLDYIDVQASVDCDHKHVALYGALDNRVARVLVRVVGGQTIEATRFDAVPAIDPQMAYWVATLEGTTSVRSITTVAADGSVLARDRDANPDSCAEEHEPTGRRYAVGVVRDSDGGAWRLDAFRGLIRDDGHLARTVCFNLMQIPSGDPLTIGGSGTCGIELTPDAKALVISSDGLGCRAGINTILYGVARRNVARIVFRGRAGWTVAVPKPAPRRLHAGGGLWLAGIHMPASGIVIDVQDRYGRTIVKDRVKPYKIPGVAGCPISSGFGTL